VLSRSEKDHNFIILNNYHNYISEKYGKILFTSINFRDENGQKYKNEEAIHNTELNYYWTTVTVNYIKLIYLYIFSLNIEKNIGVMILLFKNIFHK